MKSNPIMWGPLAFRYHWKAWFSIFCHCTWSILKQKQQHFTLKSASNGDHCHEMWKHSERLLRVSVNMNRLCPLKDTKVRLQLRRQSRSSLNQKVRGLIPCVWASYWAPDCPWWLFHWCEHHEALWLESTVWLLMRRSSPCLAASAIRARMCVWTCECCMCS